MLFADDEFMLNILNCWHHKIGLITQSCQKTCETWVVSKVGKEKDSDELGGSGGVMDTLAIQLSHLFDHHVGAYVFGDGVKSFPNWFAQKYPGRRLLKMDRLVGSRHGIFCKNAMVREDGHYCTCTLCDVPTYAALT